MAENEPSQPPAEPAAAASTPAPPAAEGGGAGEDGATTSKKAAKKAEAKAKKEAEKARRAAEREAAAVASGKGGAGAGPTEDLAKDNYGTAGGKEGKKVQLSSEAVEISLKSVEEAHVGKAVKLRGWIQNARQQGFVFFVFFWSNMPANSLTY